MRDDRAVDGDAAGEWLRTNITDPDRQISIRWDVNEERDQDAYGRLLKLLFSPRADSDAA
jgi:hypothetical protein